MINKSVKSRVKFNYKSGNVGSYGNLSPRRFKSIWMRRSPVKVLITVSYGKAKNVFGEIVEFENKGTYYNLDDALHMYRAFLEV